MERASNFKRSLEAAQYAFYRDISPEAAAAAGGIEVNPPAAKAAVPQTTTGQLRKRAEVQAPESSAAAAVGASAEAPGETGAPAGADKPSEATLPGGATAAAAPAAVTVTAAEVALTAKTEAGAGRPEKRRRAATGASLPDLLLQTAQAVSSCPEPVRHRDSSRALGGPAAQQAAARERLGTGGRTSGGLKVTHSDGYLPRSSSLLLAWCTRYVCLSGLQRCRVHCIRVLGHLTFARKLAVMILSCQYSSCCKEGVVKMFTRKCHAQVCGWRRGSAGDLGHSSWAGGGVLGRATGNPQAGQQQQPAAGNGECLQRDAYQHPHIPGWPCIGG